MPIDPFFTSKTKLKFRRPPTKPLKEIPSTVRRIGEEAKSGYRPPQRKWDQ